MQIIHNLHKISSWIHDEICTALYTKFRTVQFIIKLCFARFTQRMTVYALKNFNMGFVNFVANSTDWKYFWDDECCVLVWRELLFWYGKILMSYGKFSWVYFPWFPRLPRWCYAVIIPWLMIIIIYIFLVRFFNNPVLSNILY